MGTSSGAYEINHECDSTKTRTHNLIWLIKFTSKVKVVQPYFSVLIKHGSFFVYRRQSRGRFRMLNKLHQPIILYKLKHVCKHIVHVVYWQHQ